jgi:peroxiredoxin
MPIEAGDTVPSATLKQMTPDGIKDVELQSLLSGKKVILFGLPGAYTPVCSTAHLPGYIAEADRLRNLGERSQDGVVATINVEKSIFDHEATAASSLLAAE